MQAIVLKNEEQKKVQEFTLQGNSLESPESCGLYGSWMNGMNCKVQSGIIIVTLPAMLASSIILLQSMMMMLVVILMALIVRMMVTLRTILTETLS